MLVIAERAISTLVNTSLEIPRAEGFTAKVFLAFPVLILGMEKCLGSA